jgi:hypothetical protein
MFPLSRVRFGLRFGLLACLQPTFFKSFDDTSAGQTISPMLWDQQCPSAVPDSLRNFVTAPAASDVSTEL